MTSVHLQVSLHFGSEKFYPEVNAAKSLPKTRARMVLRRSVCTGEVPRCGCSDRLRALAADATMGPSSLKWSPASSGLCSAQLVTRNGVLFQRKPVCRSNQALGRQDAGSWAAGNSLGTDEFGNRLAIVLRHDPSRFVTDHPDEP